MASLLLTVSVFTFVLLLGNVLKEILPLLVNGQVSFGLFAQAAGLLVPFVWVFALPMGMLTATLLIFGRFSADQELTAARASGVSLLSLVSPVLVLSLVLCAISALVNLEIGPLCRVAYNNMRFKVQMELTGAALPEGQFLKDAKGDVFYVGKNRRGELEDVLVFEVQNETNIVKSMHARRGRREYDAVSKRINIVLYDGNLFCGDSRSDESIQSFEELRFEYDMSQPQNGSRSTSIDDMTFFQILEKLRELRSDTIPGLAKGLSKERLQAMSRDLERSRRNMHSKLLFQLHRQVAFSFACFGFTLVGIPLGIRVQRRETNIGIAIALVLVAIYYSFVLVAQSFDTRIDWVPYFIVWLPNFVFEAIGGVLLWRANNGI